MNSQCTEKTTEQNTQSNEDHIRLVGRPVNIAHLFGSTFHFMFKTGKFENISRIYNRFRQYRNIDSGTFDIPDTNPVHKFLCPDSGNRFSGKSPVGHHYRKSFCREVE